MPTEQASETPGSPEIFRLEVLRPILLDPVAWHVSESVVCRRGASRSILRLIKRYHRVADILDVRFRAEQDRLRKPPVKDESTAAFPSSPYSTTIGIRLTLNGKTLEQFMPWGDRGVSVDTSAPPVPPEVAARARARARVT